MFPSYFNPGNAHYDGFDDDKISISGYISKAPATGLLGAIFFVPLM